MSKIKNIEELRRHALDTLEKIDNDEIGTKEAEVTAKIYGSVTSTLKSQLEYQKAIGVQPYVRFLETDEIPMAEYKALPHNEGENDE